MAKEKQPVEIDEKAAKLKALEAALGKIEKDFGKGSIMRIVMPALKTRNCDMKVAQGVLNTLFK